MTPPKKPRAPKVKPMNFPPMIGVEDDIVIFRFGDPVFHKIDAWEASVPRVEVAVTFDEAEQMLVALDKWWRSPK